MVIASLSSVSAQQSTGDAYLDSILSNQFDNNTEQQAEAESSASKAPTPKPQLIDTAHDTRLVDDAVALRELGASTGLGLLGGPANYDGLVVQSVRIRYTSGKPTVPDQRLLDVIQTSPGSRYSSSRINDDLERLMEKGLVSGDARVAVAPQGRGVSVIFEVAPASVMGGVGFTGNRRYSDKKLRETTKLLSSKVINDRALAAARAEIIRLYQEAGYPDVKVSWRHTKTARTGYDDIIFDIQEGREVRMMNIKFTGNRQFDSKQLRQMMKTEERGPFHLLTNSGRVIREQLDDDLQEIIRHYRNYGYLRARIAKVEFIDSGKPNGPQKLTMITHIDEGPRYRVRHVSFRGNTIYKSKELEPGMSMLDGDVYSLQKVSDDTTMIRRYYGAKGYADADARPDINEVGVDKDGTRVIDICYNITEGKRYAVGRVNVRGNTKTKRHVILRELPLKPGQNMNSVDLETAKKRLENLGYFAGVDVSQAASDRAGYRDINVTVHERMTGNLTVGAAISSIESVYLYANVTQSNFDVRGLFGSGSLVGGGQRLSISGKLGFDFQSASISLLEPWFLDRKLALGNEIYFSNSSYFSDYYVQKNYGYAVSLRRALDEKNSVKLEYRIEHYNLTPQGAAPLYFLYSCGDYNRSNINLAYEFDSRDAIINPRKGGNFEAHIGYSGPGSTIQTYSAGMSGSVYYNSIWDSILSLNFGVETVDSVKKDEMVPIFERCYLGGPMNLRGFRFRDVGMIDERITGDETMGGNSSAFVQAEVTIPVVETVRFAMFVDAGFVHEDSFDFGFNSISADYGIGLRINLPMGPLAVDYAIPFKIGNAVDRDGQFQFYVDYKY
ncbi:MAG: outer membrane protein assembly factor BamA [Akkermansiaceae bacterium]|nr:outer membrane protein assembly factor BamA [Akkermansiaceae bacterium]